MRQLSFTNRPYMSMSRSTCVSAGSRESPRANCRLKPEVYSTGKNGAASVSNTKEPLKSSFVSLVATMSFISPPHFSVWLPHWYVVVLAMIQFFWLRPCGVALPSKPILTEGKIKLGRKRESFRMLRNSRWLERLMRNSFTVFAPISEVQFAVAKYELLRSSKPRSAASAPPISLFKSLSSS